MKVLLINPEFPDTYWSFRHALPFEGKRCAFPPLGLMTVSALLPESWERRMVDLNVRRLRSFFALAVCEWAPRVPSSRHVSARLPRKSGVSKLGPYNARSF